VVTRWALGCLARASFALLLLLLLLLLLFLGFLELGASTW